VTKDRAKAVLQTRGRKRRASCVLQHYWEQGEQTNGTRRKPGKEKVTNQWVGGTLLEGKKAPRVLRETDVSSLTGICK